MFYIGSNAFAVIDRRLRLPLKNKSQNSTCIFHNKHPNFIFSNCIHQIQACSLKTNSNSSLSGLMEGGYKITDQFAMYYLTCTLVGWVDLFTRRQCSQILIDSFNYCKENKGLILYAYVIMGSHIHLLAAAKEGSSGLSAIVRDFKSHTSRKIIEWITDNNKESRRYWLDMVFKYHGKYNSNNEKYQVWIQDNRPMQCVTPWFTLQKLNYIHNNPVKAGIVDHAEDYRYSSTRNYTGRKDVVLDVQLLDYGSLIGYVGY